MKAYSSRPQLDTDIRPVSEFRANSAKLLEHVRSSRRPLVLTQRGRSAAVVLDVREYERLREELDILRDVRDAEEQIARGESMSHDEARRKVMAALET